MSDPKPRKYEGVDPEVKTRRCLRCREDFKSSWAGNRLCKRCSTSAASSAPLDFISYGTGGRSRRKAGQG